MDTRWFTSDQHFYHANILRYCNRPYADVEAMNRDLIARHNARVAIGDTVIHLGDFVFGGVTRGADILAQLNGYHLIVRGNHDGNAAQLERMGFIDVQNGPVDATIDGIPVRLSHIPYVSATSRDHDLEFADIAPKDDGVGLLVCGHVHDLWRTREREINVGVDCWDYAPVREDELAAALRALPGYNGPR